MLVRLLHNISYKGVLHLTEKIKIEMAPLEGSTTSFFRSAQSRHFTAPERYFTPFIAPTQHHCFTTRELNEILPEKNEGLCVVPQLIGHNADDFLWAAGELKAMGYSTVNLNLGCPSPTVTKKKKGAGLLGDLPMLTDFLDRIFTSTPVPISIKTRVGRYDYSEAEPLAELFSRYPIAELIVHPRLEKDFYKGDVSPEAFEIFKHCNPENISFNGNLFNRNDVLAFAEKNKDVSAVMCGRGFVCNPKLAGEINGEPPLTKSEFIEFYEDFYSVTVQRLNTENQLLLHMKEYWAFWQKIFESDDSAVKKIYKSKTKPQYEIAVRNLFASSEIKNPAGF